VSVGGSGAWETPQWKAAIPDATADLLAKQVELPAEAIPGSSQLETFVDNDFPRPAADDIYFTKKTAVVAPQEPVEAPIRKTPPHAMPPVLAGLGFLAFGRKR
jgi:hypothetical protein